MPRQYLPHARLVLGIVLALGTFSSHRVAGQSTTTPGPGWSAAGTISGGCAASGTCDSSTSSPITGWFEYKPDAVRLETDEQPGPTWEGQGSPSRQQCWVRDPSGTYLLGWSAGIWHHAAYWSRVNGVWYGPNNWNWGFEHRDTCQREPTPTTVPTATPEPPTPGVLIVDVRRCTADGAPHTTDIDVTAGGQRQTARGVATAAFTVPQGSAVTAYAWSWAAWSDARGSGTAGDRVVLIVTGSECRSAPPPTPPTAPQAPLTPTQPAACRVPLPDDGSAVPLAFAGPAADVAARRYADHEGTEWTPPGALPPQGTITAGASLAVTYDFGALAATFEPDHDGEVAHLRFGLIDLTTGAPVVDVDTEDIKELTNYDGAVLIWGRTLQARTVIVAPGATFSGAPVWYGLNRIHSRPDHIIWTLGQAAPAAGRYFRTRTPMTLTYTPEPGHRYAAWTMAHRLGTACVGTHTRWVLALFADAAAPLPTPCADVCPSPVIVPGATPPAGPAATPTPRPTPTPPPPPPLPVPAGTLGLWLHAPHDPAQGVYRTGTAMPLVPQGEVIELSAAVALAALPEPPADPYWGTLYRYEQQVRAWSLVSSDGQLIGPDVCRGAGAVAEGMPGCTYSYYTMPTADDMATQAPMIWSASRLPEQAPDVWAYQLDRFRSTNVTVAVAVELAVVDTRTNTVVRHAMTPLTATVPIGLVAPRTVR